MVVQASLGKKQDAISKITRAKRLGGVAQTAEHLPSKHGVLSSNIRAIKNKKTKEKNHIVERVSLH
jgi:hypothetical protein